MQLARRLIQLTKPGITTSNTLSAAAGFFLAASIFGFTVQTGIAVIFGVAAIIASACVVNNIIDRRIDARMKRTAQRELVTGDVTAIQATLWAVLLGVTGFTLLIFGTNWPTLMLGGIAYVWYIAVYGIAKRTTPWSTLIGAVCGALPPMAGYVAVSGQLDVNAWLLFLLLMIWQMPHFYAISVFRRDDYKAAHLPVWSVRYGEENTRRQIFGFIPLFVFTVPFLVLTGAVGISYLIVILSAAVYWLIQAAVYWRKESAVKWSKRMFGVSLFVLLMMLGAISLGGYLP